VTVTSCVLGNGAVEHSMRLGRRVERLAVQSHNVVGRWHLLVRLDSTLLPYDVADDEGEAVRWVVEG